MCYISLHASNAWLAFESFILNSFYQMKKLTKKNPVEPEKILAERINGWVAMMGFWAAVGAYLTTGQIIPGVI